MTSMLKYFKPHRGSGFTASNQICLKLSVLPNEIWLHRKFIGFSAESNQFTSFGHQAWEITISDKQWDRQPVRSNSTTSQTPFRFSRYLPHRCRISHLVPRVQSRASSACENKQLYPQTHWTKKEHESHRSQMRKHSSEQHKAPLKELCFDIHEFSNLAQITWYCIYQTLSNRREGTLCRYLMSRGSSSLFIDLFICLDPFVSNDLLAPSDFHGRTSEQKSCT